MTAAVLTLSDLDWVVGTLARRREALVEQAPTFWRPAADAAKKHRAFMEYLFTKAGAKGYRTDSSVLIAAPRGDGWLVDDAYVRDDEWTGGDGQLLWDAFAAECGGAAVRLVCPTHEREKGEFAGRVGLELAESWWLRELAGSGGGQAGSTVDLPGTTALTIAAPAVYAPPGPILFLPDATDAARAVPAAIKEAPRLGCAAIVVNEKSGDRPLQTHLTRAGFRQHCDYYTGTV
jgi:hypothetical protein